MNRNLLFVVVVFFCSVNLFANNYLAPLSSKEVWNISRFIGEFALQKDLHIKQVERERGIVLAKLISILPDEKINLLFFKINTPVSNIHDFCNLYLALNQLCRDNSISLEPYPAFNKYVQFIVTFSQMKENNFDLKLNILELRKRLLNAFNTNYPPVNVVSPPQETILRNIKEIFLKKDMALKDKLEAIDKYWIYSTKHSFITELEKKYNITSNSDLKNAAKEINNCLLFEISKNAYQDVDATIKYLQNRKNKLIKIYDECKYDIENVLQSIIDLILSLKGKSSIETQIANAERKIDDYFKNQSTISEEILDELWSDDLALFPVQRELLEKLKENKFLDQISTGFILKKFFNMVKPILLTHTDKEINDFNFIPDDLVINLDIYDFFRDLLVPLCQHNKGNQELRDFLKRFSNEISDYYIDNAEFIYSLKTMVAINGTESEKKELIYIIQQAELDIDPGEKVGINQTYPENISEYILKVLKDVGSLSCYKILEKIKRDSVVIGTDSEFNFLENDWDNLNQTEENNYIETANGPKKVYYDTESKTTKYDTLPYDSDSTLAKVINIQEEQLPSLSKYISAYALPFDLLISDPEKHAKNEQELIITLNKVKAEINKYAALPSLKNDFCYALKLYREVFWSPSFDNISKSQIEAIKEDLVLMRSWIDTLHSNTPVLLKALAATNIPLKKAQELKNVLNFNNPLTSIFESLDVYTVRKLQNSGAFDVFFDFMIRIATKEQRQAPKKIVEVLSFIAAVFQNYFEIHPDFEEFKSRDLSNTKNVMKDIFKDIELFYENNLSPLNLEVFKAFQTIKNSKKKIETFKNELTYFLSDPKLLWGQFESFDEKFIEKYKFNSANKIGLLTPIIQVNNYSLEQYAKMFSRVEWAIRDSGGLKVYQAAVPTCFRNLYSFRGKINNVKFVEKSENENSRMNELIETLSECKFSNQRIDFLQITDSHTTVGNIVANPIILQNNFCSLALSKAIGIDKAFYRTLPNSDSEKIVWLNKWYDLIRENLIVNKSPIQESVDCIIDNVVSIDKIEENLKELGRHWLNPCDAKEIEAEMPQFWKNFRKAEVLWKNVEIQINNQFFKRISYKQLTDSKLEAQIKKTFETFLDAQFKFHQVNIDDAVKNKIYETFKKELGSIIAAEQKEDFLQKRKEDLKRKLVAHITDLINAMLNNIATHLSNFEVEEIDSSEKFIAGYYDDVKHLATEPMGTMICTWDQRAAQIAEGKERGFHFGVYSLKNSKAQDILFSQAQILAKDRYISLPGINFVDNIGNISEEFAIFSLLKTAKAHAEKAGLKGVVIPFDPEIHSNQRKVKAVLKKLLDANYLEEMELSSEVDLSWAKNHNYHYKKVYLVNSLPEVQMKEEPSKLQWFDPYEVSGILELKKLLNRADTEKIAFPIFIQNFEKETELLLLKEVNRVVATMPKDTLDKIKSKLIQNNKMLVIFPEAQNNKPHADTPKNIIPLFLPVEIYSNKEKISNNLALRDCLSELLASFLLIDYDWLVKNKQINENAFFKLEVVKRLLNNKVNLILYDSLSHGEDPEMLQQAINRLEVAIKVGVISESNIILNLLEDNNPFDLISQYIYLLFKHRASDKDYDTIINEISKLSVEDNISISQIRTNISFLWGLHTKLSKLSPSYFLNSSRASGIKFFSNFEELKKVTIPSIKDPIMDLTFYYHFKRLLELMFPNFENEAKIIIAEAEDQNIFENAKKRIKFIRNILEKIMTQKFSFDVLKDLSSFDEKNPMRHLVNFLKNKKWVSEIFQLPVNLEKNMEYAPLNRPRVIEDIKESLSKLDGFLNPEVFQHILIEFNKMDPNASTFITLLTTAFGKINEDEREKIRPIYNEIIMLTARETKHAA